VSGFLGRRCGPGVAGQRIDAGVEGLVSVRAISRPGRAETDMPVLVGAGDESFVGTSRNIGLGGLCLAVDRTLRIGDRLAVKFTLPNQGLPCSLTAEVRWVRDEGQAGGVGLRFVNPPIAAAVAIHEFLREADPDLTPSSRWG